MVCTDIGYYSLRMVCKFFAFILLSSFVTIYLPNIALQTSCALFVLISKHQKYVTVLLFLSDTNGYRIFCNSENNHLYLLFFLFYVIFQQVHKIDNLSHDSGVNKPLIAVHGDDEQPLQDQSAAQQTD